MKLTAGELAGSRTYRHNAADDNSVQSAQAEEQRGNECIPKNVDADVEHGHEEADALEKVTNK